MYAPMVIIATIGIRYLTTRLSSRGLVAGMLVLALVFPGAMLVSHKATPGDPVFDEQYPRYSATGSELAAVETISTIHPDDGPTLRTDHPYRTVFTRWQGQEARGLPLSAVGTVNADAAVYRSYQSTGAASARYDDDWYQLDDHNPAALSAAHGHGTTDKWTGIPITTEVTCTFYRTDLYEKHGLEEPETYAELRQNAKVLDENEDMPGVVNRGLRGFGMNAYPMNSMLRSWGGQLWNSYPDDSGLDDPEAIEAGEYYVNLLRDYGPSDAESYAWSDSLTAMQQGNAAQIANDANLFWGGLTGEDAAVPDKIGITTLPVPDVEGGQFAPNAFTWTISTSKASDNSEAAFLFMLFATSPEATRFMGEKGAPFITRESAWESDWYREQIDDTFADVTQESLSGAIPDTFDARYPEWAEEYSVHLQSAIAGDKSAEQAFMDAASDAERLASQ
jgi:ABC-type glycerol-3-phosphate transport system substrate-binding protein